MQKKIIVVAIAAALAAPGLALAEVTAYGQLNMSVDMVKDGASTNGKTYNQLNSNSSRLGFKGTEDLGNGMAVVVQLEGAIGGDTGTTGTSLFNRNTYLGLNTPVGNVMVGNNDTAYKTATRRLDMFMDGIADNRGSQIADTTNNPLSATAVRRMGDGHDARLKNALNYVSPTFSGVTVMASTIFGGENKATVAAADKKGTLYSLAGTFEQGPIYATLAYQTMKVGDAGTGDLGSGNTIVTGVTLGAKDDKYTATKLGGGYSVEKFAVNAVFEQIKNTYATAGAGSDKGTNIYVAGKFNITGADAVKAAVTKIGDTKNGGTNNYDGAKQYSVGFDHAMSKRTTAYALYTKLTPTDDPAVAGAPNKPSALSVGLKHAF